MSTVAHPPHVMMRLFLEVAGFVLPRGRWGDRLYLRLRFLVHHGRWPSDSMRFNDVLHRNSLSPEFRSPLVALTTDKAAAKTFIELVVGPERVVPTFAVLRTAEEIRRYDFPDRCVIKGTLGSGQVIFKAPGDRVDRRILVKWLRQTHYHSLREANYKPFRNAVIVEQIVAGAGAADDIKILCHDGKARFAYVNSDVAQRKTRRLFDLDWRPLDVGLKFPVTDGTADRPEPLAEMVEAAERIAAHFRIVRVDFFAQGPDWWVGEITHLDGAAGSSFMPLSGEREVNRLMFGDKAHAGPYETHGALGSAHREAPAPDRSRSGG